MKAHELARQLMAGPDVPVVILSYDDEDHRVANEAVTCNEYPSHHRWYDSNKFHRHETAIALSTDGPGE